MYVRVLVLFGVMYTTLTKLMKVPVIHHHHIAAIIIKNQNV